MNSQFRRLSARLGQNPLLTQAAGGNTSWKEGNSLWIKASGKWLACAESEDIFLPLDLDQVRSEFTRGNEDYSDLTQNASTLRPSIETAFHAIIPHTVVLHVHSIHTIAHAVRTDAEQILEKKLHGLHWAWVPYARPGLPLTRKIETTLTEKPDVWVLQNHGLIVGAGSCEEASELLNEVEKRLYIEPRTPQAGASSSFDRTLALDKGFIFAEDNGINSLATDHVSLELSRRGVLYPDHVVFLGTAPVVAHTPDEAFLKHREYEKRWKKPPPYFVAPGCGVFFEKPPSPTVLEMLRCQSLVLQRIDAEIPLNILGDSDIAQLLNWDAEVYRQALER